MADNNKTGCKLFVANLPTEVEKPDVLDVFTQCGEIVEAHVVHNGKACYAFVTMRTREQAAQGLLFDGSDYGGRRMVVRMARSDSKK